MDYQIMHCVVQHQYHSAFAAFVCAHWIVWGWYKISLVHHTLIYTYSPIISSILCQFTIFMHLFRNQHPVKASSLQLHLASLVLQGCMPLPPISGRSRARVDCEARVAALSTLWTFSISRLFGRLLSANSMSCCIISHLKRFVWWSLPLHVPQKPMTCLVFVPGGSEWDQCQGIGNRVLPECVCPSRFRGARVLFLQHDHVGRM